MCRSVLALAVAATVPIVGRAADDFKPEEGFTLLLAGNALDGWKLSRGPVPLDGQSEAAGRRIVLRDGVLTIDPKVKEPGRIHTVREFGGDATLRLEFRPGPGCDNDFYFRGQKFDLKKAELKTIKDGEWNTYEVIVTGDRAEAFCNGVSVRKLKAKPEKTPIRIVPEFGPIEIRRLRVKEGK
jgi:hypothetical protein